MVHVFKTTVTHQKHVKMVEPYLEEFRHTIKWTFDLQDCDHILRIETRLVSAKEIIEKVRKSGFEFIEL